MKKVLIGLILIAIALSVVVLRQKKEINQLKNKIFINASTIDTRPVMDFTSKKLMPLAQGAQIPYTAAQQFINNYLPNADPAPVNILRSFWIPINVFTDYLTRSQGHPLDYAGNIAAFKLSFAKENQNSDAVSLVVVPFDNTGKFILLDNGLVYNQIAGCPAVCPETFLSAGTIDQAYNPNQHQTFYAQYDKLIDRFAPQGVSSVTATYLSRDGVRNTQTLSVLPPGEK